MWGSIFLNQYFISLIYIYIVIRKNLQNVKIDGFKFLFKFLEVHIFQMEVIID